MPKTYSLRSIKGGDGNSDNNMLGMTSKDIAADKRFAKNFLFETLDIVFITVIFTITLIFPLVAAYYSQKTYKNAQDVTTANPSINFGDLVKNSKTTYGLTLTVGIFAGIALIMWVWKFINAMQK